jgi:hypothetical protein
MKTVLHYTDPSLIFNLAPNILVQLDSSNRNCETKHQQAVNKDVLDEDGNRNCKKNAIHNVCHQHSQFAGTPIIYKFFFEGKGDE